MSCSKLIINFKNGQPIFQQQLRQLSSLSEIRRSSARSKPTAIDQIKSDIVVVGDGVLANSIAYWLKSSNPNRESVTVIESENFIQPKFNAPCYSQFNSVEGIQLSKFTKQFISRLNADFKLRPTRDNFMRTNTSANDEHQLIEQKSSIGLLQLCESIADETELIKYNKLFKQLFASTEYASELLNSKQLNEMFTWLDSDNVRLGRFHSRDDFALTNINLVQLNDVLRKKAEQLGVQYVKGKITEMNAINKYEEDIYGVTSLKKNCNEMTIDRCLNRDLNVLTNLKFKKLIIATSADQSRMIANKLGLDNQQWPVEERQRLIYEIHCKELRNENIPVIVDSFGLWLRKDQQTGNFYCGLNNQEYLKADLNKITNFSKHVWTRLMNYISSLKNIEIINVHQQNYDYNLIDDTVGIVGLHPDISNLYWILGFNGNHEGIWAPGLGRATSELVNQKRFNIINLDKLGWRSTRCTSNNSRLKQRLSN